MWHRYPTNLIAIILTILFSSTAYGQEQDAPYISPLGDLSQYSSVELVKNSSIEFEIPLDEGFRTRNVVGDIWYLNQEDAVEQGGYQQQLKTYGESIGAEILRWDPDFAILRKDAGNGEIWWCQARFEAGLELAVIKTLRLYVGKSIAFAMGKGGSSDVSFFTINPGGKFRSLTVTIPDGEYTITAEQVITAGAYKRTINGKWPLEHIRANRFVLDTIPQEAGYTTFKLYTNSDAPPAEVIVELTEYPYPIPQVEIGEKLGALRIKNVPYGLARVLTESQFGVTYVEHPEIMAAVDFRYGDVTPEGDSYFLLPSGLWQVEVAPTKTDKARAIQANFIPVHAGKETVLDWPLAMTSVFGDDGDSGLEINEIERRDSQVEVTFSLHGQDTKSIIPTPAALAIKEGGVEAEVLSVERSNIPMDIVLLLDSSGSMKGQMKNAIDATRKFILSLLGDASIRVVDFDTNPRVLKGITREEALEGLLTVRANGATSLNDSILKGIEMLESAKRPALLLFTDGFDANHDDTGPGSKATKTEVLAVVRDANIPLFTIGFGEGHDVITLDRLAALSGGRYYPANNPAALDDVFAVISSNLNNTFTAQYKRPTRGRPSDVPVVTIMVDVSGSMDTTPEKSGCDYRIDKVKAILHDFVIALPDEVLSQVMSFEDDIYINQVTSANKGAILTGLNYLYANGGTNIGGAVYAAMETQAAIPTSKRYMVFITDAALEVDGEEGVLFETMLAKMKDENIYSLWVGIGALDDSPFKHAAELSGGDYVLTESPEELGQAFDVMIADIRKPSETLKDVQMLVEVTLKHREKSGRNLTFASAEQVNMPAPVADDSIDTPASISYSMTDLQERYDAEVSAMITGDSIPVRDAQISKRIPINASGENEAASFTVKDAYFMNRLRGVDAPYSWRYLVLTTGIKNILPVQEVTVYPDGTNHPASWLGNDAATKGKQVQMIPSYLIPDLKRHLFLRWNNELTTAVSPATWLTEAPLILPGENAVVISPQAPVEGALVFMVPEGHMKQMSLHYYDTNYGHAEIPLVGTMDKGIDRISALPPGPPVKLSDSFSLSIREVKDVHAVGKQEAGSGSVYRIVEADLISNVQALLDINPAERFSLTLNTREGTLNVRLHNVTGLLPLGFLAPTMLSPGSNNRIRLAFRVPESVVEEAGLGELVVDVKGGGVTIPLDERAADKTIVQVPAAALQGEGIDLVVNSLNRFDDDMYVADMTLFDKKDGQSTSMSNAFILKKKGFENQPMPQEAPMPDYGKSKGLAGFATGNAFIPIGTMPPDSTTDDLVFGITDSTVVPDGASLRGLVVFKLPYGDSEPEDWMLTSQLFPSLNEALGTEEYQNEFLLIRTNPVTFNATSYLEDLHDAVAQLKRQREARQFKRPGYIKPKVQDVDGDGPPLRNVPVPEITEPAYTDFASLKNITELKKRLATVSYLPGDGSGWNYHFAPQAVLTQNWGSEGDLARMAEIILARQGVYSQRIEVEVTDEGRKRLAALSGFTDVDMEKLPALLYRDARDIKHILVAPFLESITRLSGLVRKTNEEIIEPMEQVTTLTVSLQVKAKGGGKDAVNRDISNALGGETDVSELEWMYLLTANPTLPELSRGAVDIGYTVVGYQAGAVVKAIFDGNDERVISSESIDTGEYEVVGERIEISMGDGTLVYSRELSEGEEIVDRFHTLGLNLPDMDTGAARSLDVVMQNSRENEDAPDKLSAIKWYSRNLIYKFIVAQTEYERELAEELDLLIGRNTKPRCIIATVSRPQKNGNLVTTIDLRQIANQVHPGSYSAKAAGIQASDLPVEQAKHSFNILSGVYSSKFEAGILPEGGMGFFEMMAYFPQDTELLWLTSEARYGMADEFKASGIPEHVLSLLEENSNVVLFPSQPAIINNQPRWAWLEVNPDTYETMAVLDTGDRGAMVERVFSDLWKDGLDYITGGLVGISSSVWSVSAFSLIMSDYKEILKAAKKFALGLADNFSATVKIGDFEFKAKPGDSSVSGEYTGAGSDAIKEYKKGKDMFDKINDPKIDLGGFEGGFKDGVNYYFSKAGG